MLNRVNAKVGYVARQLGHSVVVLTTIYSKWLDGPDNVAEEKKIEHSISAIRPGTGPKKTPKSTST